MKHIQFKLTAVISEYVGIDFEDYCKGVSHTDDDSQADSELIDMICSEEENDLAEILKDHLGQWELEFTDVSEIEVTSSRAGKRRYTHGTHEN